MDANGLRLVVFDVDGTLYSQPRLRARMALEAGITCVTHPRSIRDLLIVSSYRTAREKVADAARSDDLSASWTAARFHCSEPEVLARREEWLMRRPLRHLATCKREGLDDLLSWLRSLGVKVGAWSDYPAQDKLEALGLEFDIVVSSEDEDVRALKPCPLGLQKAMRVAGARPDQTLMVGDRISRDSEAARAVGVPFLMARETLADDVRIAAERFSHKEGSAW